ncbi:8-oxoguanine DNA glycosylase [Candidatus Bathyarchaeota archaeon]|nr:8-oxoguanine DNA glycosylase [Candidatus Bathyarchaeota archaeon]
MKLDGVPLNLDVTLCCGQVFRWDKKGDWWYGVAGGKALKVRQVSGELEFANADAKFVETYFGLDDDLQEISAAVGRDEHIRQALREFWGLRIIRQDPWECLISYICATYKNIPAIRHMLLSLSSKFGEKTVLDGMEFFTFPAPEKLAGATAKDLLECGLGYRAKYVLETSKRIFENDFELASLRQLPYEQAKKQICRFAGVGPKVADCVLLFSLGKTEAFPVDRWIERVILNHYVEKLPPELAQKLNQRVGLTNSDYAKLNLFGREYFGEYAGYAQEYLYHYERMKT